MINFITNLNPTIQALIAGLFTWSITAMGAIIVFFLKKDNKNIMDIMLSIAAGVMVAASFFSLLLPSIEMSNNLNMISWIVVSVSLLLGGLLIVFSDTICNKLTKNKNIMNNNSFKRCFMLITSITMHNIPEGLAIGVAFGSIMYNLDSVTIISAWMLAIGIGIQNFPEGAAVSLPLMREGMPRSKAFLYGQASGIVEPISSFIGALIVTKVRYLLPFFLAFAAGAMLYVVAIELIPESQKNKHKNLMAYFFLIGFSIMMILDIALG